MMDIHNNVYKFIVAHLVTVYDAGRQISSLTERNKSRKRLLTMQFIGTDRNPRSPCIA